MRLSMRHFKGRPVMARGFVGSIEISGCRVVVGAASSVYMFEHGTSV